MKLAAAVLVMLAVVAAIGHALLWLTLARMRRSNRQQRDRKAPN